MDDMLAGRPVPIVSVETKPFWDACQEGVFLVQQCADCGKFQYHYRGFCCHCWSSDIVDHPIAGHGEVWTYTVIERNRSAGFADIVPYVVALVEIAEGLKILSNIVNCDPRDVRIGMPVTLTFVDGDGFRLAMFEPAPARPEREVAA